MKKGGRAVLAALCICILAAGVLQIRSVSTINTVRTFMFDDESREPVQDAVRICTYVGYDDADLNSRVRAEILWDTLKVESPGGEVRFSLTDLEP